MANYLTTDTELTSIADAIRTKGGTQAQLTFPTGFVSAINAIQTGGGTVENAASLYAANTGNKYEITLDNNGSYRETNQDTPSNLYSYLASGITFYGMVANSSGNVVWKGSLMESMYTTDTQINYYTLTGGSVQILRYESSYEDGHEDPDTGEWITTWISNYNVDVATQPNATKVYISSLAF